MFLNTSGLGATGRHSLLIPTTTPREPSAFRASVGNGLFSTLKVIHYIRNCAFDNDFVILRKHDSHAASTSIPQKTDERRVYRDRFTGLRFEETQF
jgi:hypothetical protein